MSRLQELYDTRSKITAEVITNACEKTPEEIIDDLFTYHSPNQLQQQAYTTIRDAAKHLALVIWKNCPPGADRTAAIRKLRDAVMTANAAIALRGTSLS